jgi:hypothetical protein
VWGGAKFLPATVLLLAGALKLIQFYDGHSQFSLGGSIFPSRFLPGVAFVELIVSVHLFLTDLKAPKIAALVLFGAFFGIGIAAKAVGETQCACFGVVSAPVNASMAISVVGVWALMLALGVPPVNACVRHFVYRPYVVIAVIAILTGTGLGLWLGQTKSVRAFSRLIDGVVSIPSFRKGE